MTPPSQTIERIERADTFFASTKADIRTGGNRAFYAIDADYIQMPPIEAFRNAESFAATLGHEDSLVESSLTTRPGFRAETIWR